MLGFDRISNNQRLSVSGPAKFPRISHGTYMRHVISNREILLELRNQSSDCSNFVECPSNCLEISNSKLVNFDRLK